MVLSRLLGIDIGGTGIKGAPVDVVSGAMPEPRRRIDTPTLATPDEVATIVRTIVEVFAHIEGPVGCTFPAIVRFGRVRSAANVAPSWIGVDAAQLFSDRCEREVLVINDADAAGLAEVRFGSAAGQSGVVLMLTLGTGIGSALYTDGVLVPNTELGHLEIDGQVAETMAAGRVRKSGGLSVEDWAKNLNRYLNHLERLFSPDLIVIGGGVSKKFDEFGHLLDTMAEVVPAALRNDAGIVGAALWAGDQVEMSNSR